MTHAVKPICFYLPQFHAIPENDRWWGKGFTEWTLTNGARPLFENHRQPRVPIRELGQYNLLEPEIRRKQGDIARAHGIHGFCYYHFWFRGKTLLERPLELMLEDGYPAMPFCLCWANEPWSRRWTGEDQDVLQAQDYGDQADWDAHFEYLARFFRHPRYLRVDGRPMMLIYRLGHIGNAERMLARWRELARESGFEDLHLVAVEGGVADNRIGPEYVDAVAEHHPTCLLDRAVPIVKDNVSIVPVEQLWSLHSDKPRLHRAVYPGACHAWDNTPRRGRKGVVVLPSTPRRFAAYLQTLCHRAASDPALAEPFVFLNAWNEWSEGAFLEPDQSYGFDWLTAIADAVRTKAPAFDPPPPKMGGGRDLSRTPSTHGRLSHGRSTRPDVDFLFAVISQRTRGENVLEHGCETAATSEHLRWLLGARRYIGLDPNPDWVRSSRTLLGEVHQVDGERIELDRLNIVPDSIDVLVCRQLLAHVSDPPATCARLASALAPGGIACLGLPHAGAAAVLELLEGADGSPPSGGDIAHRRFTLPQAKDLIAGAGLELLKVYRVFHPKPLAGERLKESENTVTLGRQQISGLTREQVMNLSCVRLIVFARRQATRRDTFSKRTPEQAGTAARNPDTGAAAPSPTDSFQTYRRRVNTTISPQDPLFPIYQKNQSAAAYFDSAFAQLQVIDQFLSVHTSRRLVELTNIADYACNFGRLLRALRAINPDSTLYAYDIDPRATAFCAQQFHCKDRTVGWEPEQESTEVLHDLICCISLVTHTDVDFYQRVLRLWARMLAPGGLLYFTYLGSGYIDQWLQGKLNHYGEVEPSIRRAKAREFAVQGHAYAACKTAFATDEHYGVGFMSDATVRQAIDTHPGLEHIATLAGETSVFSQDLAIARRTYS